MSLFFKAIESEAAASGIKITNIFSNVANQVRAVFSQTSTIKFSDTFSQGLVADETALVRYSLALKSGMSEQEAFNATMHNASPAAQQFAQTMTITGESLANFTTKQKLSEITLMAQNKSLANVRSMLNTYNSGLSQLGVSQQQFVQSVGQSNSVLGQYLAGLNGAEATMDGYIGTLISAKVATIGLRIATTALNAVIGMGIGLIISLVMSGISKLIESIKTVIDDSEALREKTEEVTRAFESQKQSLSDTKSKLDSLASRYEALSKGVDGLNQNVSLSNEEYSEYLDICNQIGDMFPSLIQGYDEQGNAILTLKGNVEDLTQAYNNMVIATNNSLLVDGKTLFKDFKNQVKELNESNLDGNAMTLGTIENLDKILNSPDLDDAISQYAAVGTTSMVQIVKALKDAGLKPFYGTWYKLWTDGENAHDFIKRAIQENRAVVQSIVVDWNTQADEATKNMVSLAQAYIDNSILQGNYSNVTSNMQGVLSSLISSFDYNFYNSFEDVDDLYSYLAGMLDDFNSLSSDDRNTLELAFNAKTALNNGECTVDEYLDRINGIEDAISNLDDDTQAQIRLLLNDDDFGDIKKLDEKIKEYNALTKEILNCADAQEKNKLIAEQNALGKEIEEVTNLITQYDELTAAYERWQTAQSSENEGTKYDTIAEGLEGMKDLYNKGLVGTDDFKTAVQLMSNQDLTNATVDQLMNAYEVSFPKMQRYFKEGQSGCQNFLNDISKLNSEWAHMNEDGSWEIDFNDEEVAEKLGISVGAVQAIMKKLKDFGFDIDLSSCHESLADLKSATEAANDKLKELGKTEIDFNVNSTNIDDLIGQIDSASKILDTFKKEDGTVDLSVEGAQEAKTILAALIYQKQQVSEPAIIELNFNAETAKTEIESAALLVNDFRTKYRELEVKIATGEDTSALQTEIQGIVTEIEKLPKDVKTSLGLNTEEFTTAVSTLTSETVDVKAGITLDAAALATFNTTLLNITPEMLVKAGLDDTLIKDYVPDEKSATVKYKVDDSAVKKYNPPNLNRTVYYTVKQKGEVGARGTAFAQGNWGASKSGIALGGELGQELVVRNGKFFTIGDEGAEFFNYQKDDIIFNAEQTKQIFEKGKISSGNRRGRALAEGTAFASGSGKFYTSGKSTTAKNNSSSSSSKKSSSKESSNTEKEEPQIVDWIEIALSRVQRAINNLSRKAESTFKKLSTRLEATNDEISKVNEEINLQQKAYDQYIAQANAVGLDESWASKVRNGKLEISSVTDDNLKEKIQDYQEWYEKALDCKDAIDDLHESVAGLYEDKFNNIKDSYDNDLTAIEHKANMLNEYIDRTEEIGLLGSTRYYTALQKVEMENMMQLKNKQTDLENALNEAINSGEIEVYSEAWYELQGSIDEVTEAIEKSKTALKGFDKQMRQIEWDRFDYMQEGLTQITDESDFLISLLSSSDLYNTTDPKVREFISLMQENSSRWHSASVTEKASLEQQNREYAKRIANLAGKNVEIDNNGVWWIDDKQLYSSHNNNYGGLSDTGLSVLGLHGLNYNTYMEQSKAYANELVDIDKQLAESPYDTNLIKRRQELLKLQRESILAAEEEKQSMTDLIKDGIEEQVNALKELIDAYIDSLDSAKDLYDYQKKVKEHTEDIAALEKQLAAYQNDTSEETKSKIQKIKVDLEEARENLQDTEYDKYISDQKELLNDLYDEYESLMNEQLNNIDASIDKLIGEVNDNASTINSTLVKETAKVGTTMSSEMQSVWTSESQALTNYFGDTGIILNSVNGYFENTNTTLSGINTAILSILTGVNDIVAYASYQARVDIDPEGSKNQMIQNSMDWWATDDENVRNSLVSENEKYGEAFGYTSSNGSWYDSDGNLAYEITTEDNIRNIISKMIANSEAWHGASDSERNELSSANEKYAQKIQSLTDQPIYKDSNGIWWIGDRELYSYKSGGIANFTGAAWLDGTPSKPELVLNAEDTENFLALKDTLKHMSEQGLSLANVGYGSMDMPQLSGLTDISSILRAVRQANNLSGGNTIGGIEINIPIEHVDDYNDFIAQLQKDRQFEKFIRSVSVDLLSGGSTLAKNKYKW